MSEDALGTLMRALAEAVQPLADAFASPVEFAAFAGELGWAAEADFDIEAVKRAFGTLPADAGALAGTAVALTDALRARDRAALVAAVRAAIPLAQRMHTTLGGLKTPGAPDGLPDALTDPAFWERFPRDVLDHLVYRYLEQQVASLFAPLRLLGVLRPGAIDWDALLALATDPGRVLAGAHRSGNEFDTAAFFEAVLDAARALQLDVQFGDGDALGVPLWWDVDETGPALTIVGVALGLVPIPARGAASGPPVGLALVPEATAAVEVELASGVALDVSGAIDAIPVELRPGDVTVEAGDARGSIVLRSDRAWTPIGAPGGTRLEVSKAHAALHVVDDEVKVEAGLDAARLVLDAADLDGFLAQFLGPQELDFAVTVAWSNLTGVTLGGRAGLTTEIPVDALGVDTVTVALAGDLARRAAVLAITASGSAALGPLTASVQDIGVQASLGAPPAGAQGSLGGLDARLGFRPPTGVGLEFAGGPVTGGGFLAYDPERGQYAGEAHLQFERIAVRAIGLLTTGSAGFSLLVIISADFPPVQLGLGFRLVGVGGLLGINRTVAVEALRAGLKTGAVDAVLSPPDPKANSAQLVASLAGLFPQAPGRHVFAPTARIVWGSPTLITIDLCLALELPSPVRLIALGRMRAVLPDEREAIVRVQVDVLGVIDFDQQTAAVDATLVDSRLAQFALTGDMALRMSWGARPSFLLAVGGFHPRFAAPPGFPELQRVAVALAAGDNPKLRLEAYLALTSNTVQFGARVDLGAKAGSFSIAGFLSFDALLTLEPLAFEVDIAAKLAVKMGGRTLLSVSLALTLSGPRPWRAHGRASFSILFLDVSFGFDVTIGDETPAPLPAPVDVAPLLLAALADARAWSAQLPAGADVVTLRKLDPGTAVLAHPLGTLQVRQRVAPLERTLERFGTSVPSGAKRFGITLATIGGVRTTITPLRDRFAPAQFTALSDDAKLSAPSFEEMVAGATLGADGFATGPAVNVGVVYEQVLVTPAGIAEPKPQKLAMPADVFSTLTATPPRGVPAFAIKDAA